jgi:hypothetical protein
MLTVPHGIVANSSEKNFSSASPTARADGAGRFAAVTTDVQKESLALAAIWS